MRRILIGLIFALLLNSGCTICRTYGPFMGKVVDKQTGEPIEGAVAYIHFTSHAPFNVTSWQGGWEVLTDRNGEFEFPRATIWRYRFLEKWDPMAWIIIFKPGYKEYAGPGADTIEDTSAYPENEKLLIKLPRLTGIEERKSNLRSIQPKPPFKMKLFYQLYNQESVSIGLRPIPMTD